MKSARIASGVLEAACWQHTWAFVLLMDLRTLERAEGGQPRGLQRQMKLFLVSYALDYPVFYLGSGPRGHPNSCVQLEVTVALSG